MILSHPGNRSKERGQPWAPAKKMPRHHTWRGIYVQPIQIRLLVVMGSLLAVRSVFQAADGLGFTHGQVLLPAIDVGA